MKKLVVIVAILVAGAVYANSYIDKKLERAKAKHAKIVAKANKDLIEAYDDAIKAYTKDGNLEKALALKEEKEGIEAKGQANTLLTAKDGIVGVWKTNWSGISWTFDKRNNIKTSDGLIGVYQVIKDDIIVNWTKDNRNASKNISGTSQTLSLINGNVAFGGVQWDKQ